MHLNYKTPINNPFADRAQGSQFLWTLHVELDKTRRVQVKLCMAQFQLSDLGTDMSGEHLDYMFLTPNKDGHLSYECA